MGTDDSASDQSHPRPSDPRPSDGPTAFLQVRLRRGVGGVWRAAGRLWRRTALALVAVITAVQAALSRLRGERSRDREPPVLATRPDGPVRTVLTADRHDRPSDHGHQLAETDGGARPRQLPGPTQTRRRLPAGEGRLQVDQTPERLTLSDPDDDEAYLSSTVWVDVEE